jgi:transposase
MSTREGILLGATGFSSQKPERRAIERDESAVLAWKRETWPALRKSVPPSGD